MEQEISAIWDKIEGLTPSQIEREIKRTSIAQEKGKQCVVNGHKVNPETYLLNLEGVLRGLHPAFRFVSTDPASFYFRPSDPKKIKAIRVYSTY